MAKLSGSAGDQYFAERWDATGEWIGQLPLFPVSSPSCPSWPSSIASAGQLPAPKSFVALRAAMDIYRSVRCRGSQGGFGFLWYTGRYTEQAGQAVSR
jgi:hypothetical protein